MGLNQAFTSGNRNFCQFFFAKLFKLCQVAQGSGVNRPFHVQPQILYWIEAWATHEYSPCWLQTISMSFSLYALSHCLAVKYIFSQVIVLLQTESGCPLGFPICCCIHFTLFPQKPSRACWSEASPRHDVATTTLHGEDGVFLRLAKHSI